MFFWVLSELFNFSSIIVSLSQKSLGVSYQAPVIINVEYYLADEARIISRFIKINRVTFPP